MSNFIKNYQEDVSNYVEKKGNLDYLSWGYAQKKGMELDENFKWKIIPFDNGKLTLDGMVKIFMHFKGNDYEHCFPVLDFKNKSIANPNSFDINTAQMRGMAKLFAMVSGYGLTLYTGEDIKNIDGTGQGSQFTQQGSQRPQANPDQSNQVAYKSMSAVLREKMQVKENMNPVRMILDNNYMFDRAENRINNDKLLNASVQVLNKIEKELKEI